jgi:hypothetical protein
MTMAQIRIAKWAEIRRVTKSREFTRTREMWPHTSYPCWEALEWETDIADKDTRVALAGPIPRSDSAFKDHDPHEIPAAHKHHYWGEPPHGWRFLLDERRGLWSEVLVSAPEVNRLWKTVSWPHQMKDWSREDIARAFEYLALGQSEAHAENYYTKDPNKREVDGIIRKGLLAGDDPAEVRKAVEAEHPYETIPKYYSHRAYREIPEQKPDDQWATDWSRATCSGPCGGPVGCRWCH